MFHNPFSTCNIKPGAIPFFFEKNFLLALRTQNTARFDKYFYETFSCEDSNTGSWVALQFLADCFEDLGFCAQINGPHGAGKSTLLAGLEKVLRSRGNKIFTFALHDNQKIFPLEFWKGIEDLTGSKTPHGKEDSSDLENAKFADQSDDFNGGHHKNPLETKSLAPSSFKKIEKEKKEEKERSLLNKNSELEDSSMDLNPNSATDNFRKDSANPAPNFHVTKKFVFLDGYEQLSLRSRLRFHFLCRKNGLGCLITTHKTIMGYPILLHVKPSLEQLRQVVGYLTEDQDILFELAECSELFEQYRGNIRDVLFALYDEFEERRTLLDFHKKITAHEELPPL